MSDFFDTDRDEFSFGGRVYCDYFNLYPNLAFDVAFKHVSRLGDLIVLDSVQSASGWQMAVSYRDVHFLLDTHFHGTSTLFCAEKGAADELTMLAFLGWFFPVIRDEWVSGSGNQRNVTGNRK